MSQIVVTDPATLQPIQSIDDFDVPAALAAVDRASKAFGAWSQHSPRDRADVLRRAYELMLRDERELSNLISAENGKSNADALAEVGYAADFLRWFSEEAVRGDGRVAEAPSGGALNLVVRRPVGVAALVTPWNFPAAMVTRKVGPALAAGCTAVLKPAEETPLTALALARLLEEAGLPPGAFEVVPTSRPAEVVEAWMRDPRIRKISFTGSTPVGRILLHQAADRVLNASMELGGNAPVVVTDDADVNLAVREVMTAKFRNAGQACTAANRLYVHRHVAQEFVEKLVSGVRRLSVGPASTGADIGPLISAAAVRRVESLVSAAVADGAQVDYRAELGDYRGHFFPPTVLTSVPPTSALLQCEVFGPVAPVVTWDEEGTLLDSVNASEFGLAAYVFSGSVERAMRLADGIEAGMVGVNRGMVSDVSAPFGGVKQSGLGREGSREGLHEYQEIQYRSVRWKD